MLLALGVAALRVDVAFRFAVAAAFFVLVAARREVVAARRVVFEARRVVERAREPAIWRACRVSPSIRFKTLLTSARVLAFLAWVCSCLIAARAVRSASFSRRSTCRLRSGGRRRSASRNALRPALTARPTTLDRLLARFLVAMPHLQNAAPRMAARLTAAPEKHLIKKYANRKLYDTRTSRYITLDGIAQLVRQGHEVTVVDRDDGSDLTQLTLSQIVLSEEKRGPARIVDAGGEMLHDRGQALFDYVRRTLNVPSELRSEVGRRREGLESMADDAIERALRRLRIPTRKDYDRLNDRLDRIAAQLKKAGLANGAGPGVRTGRKRRRD